jgi:hypothetical protein
MAAFRRCILALALLAVFAGLASAQSIVPMVCTATPFPNAMRAEGKNELIGDLVISCTGGNPLTNGTAAPRVDFTLTLPQAVTSRLASTPTTTAVASDALLLIDDPNPAAPPIAGAIVGFGSNAVPLPCISTGTTSAAIQVDCPTFVESDAGTGIVYSSSTAVNPPVTSADNIYQGQVLGNTVKFVGVPVVVPGNTSGVARTFRITNVRMNATAATAGAQAISVSITSTSGQTGNPAGLFGSSASIATNLGNVAAGLSATGTKWTASTPGLTTCSALTLQYAGTITFAEAFGSAFKTRHTPGAALNSAQSAAARPNTIPQAYQTESGYTPTANGLPGGADIAALDIGGKTAGQADFGTRLKAVFTNIPSGARVFVSFGNVERQTSSNIGFENANFIDPAAGNILAAGAAGTTATTSFAALITGGETAAESTATPYATPSNTPGGSIYASPVFGYNELTVSSTGSATAVWEVVNTNSTANESLTFDVFVTQAAQGTTGTATVNLSFAPTSATATTIPTFADTSGSGVSSLAITSCRTILVYPYVTSASGFDTGLAVSNTTMDILGTTAQAGTCQLFVYGINPATGNAPTNNGPFSPTNAAGAAFPASGVPSGQTAQWLLSASAPGFTGYAIASCNFQYAHGFAFVYSPGLSAAMGYLPLVLGSPVTRGSSPETSFP